MSIIWMVVFAIVIVLSMYFIKDRKLIINVLAAKSANFKRRLNGVEALGNLGDKRAVTSLLRVLSAREEPIIRTASCKALGKIGDPRAVDPLAETLNNTHEGSDVRKSAAEALGEFGNPRAVEPLIKALQATDKYSDGVRYEASKALQKLADHLSPEPFIKLMTSHDYKDVRAKAATILGKLNDPGSIKPLINALDDDDEYVRIASSNALGKLGDPRAAEPLIRLLGDKHSVRKAAAEALGKLGEPDWETLVEGDASDFSRLGDSNDPRVVLVLIKALLNKSENHYARENAAQSLGRLVDPRAFEPLSACLYDKDVSYYASRSLLKYGDKAFAPLVKALGDDNRDICKKAAWALGELNDPRAIDPLVKAFNKIDYSAAHSLIKFGGRALGPLVKTLLNGDEESRGIAAFALGELNESGAIEPLIKALGDSNKHVRKNAAKSLAKFNDPRTVEPFITALDDEEIRDTAAEALGRLGDPRAVTPLQKALDKGKVMSAAVIKALYDFDDPRGVEFHIENLFKTLGGEYHFSQKDERVQAARELVLNYKRGRINPGKYLLLKSLMSSPHTDKHVDKYSCTVHEDGHTDKGLGLSIDDF